jgi:hypothetical protein
MWEDDGRVFSRDWLLDADGRRRAVLTVRLAAEHPLPASINRLAHEFALKEELESAWALRPVDLRRDRDRTILVLEDSSCELLNRLLGAPMEIGSFFKSRNRHCIPRGEKPPSARLGPQGPKTTAYSDRQHV